MYLNGKEKSYSQLLFFFVFFLMGIKKEKEQPWMVITKTQLSSISLSTQTKTLSYLISQISLFLKPIPIARKKNHTIRTFTGKKTRLALLLARNAQEFKASSERERGRQIESDGERELVVVMESIYHGPWGEREDQGLF